MRSHERWICDGHAICWCHMSTHFTKHHKALRCDRWAFGIPLRIVSPAVNLAFLGKNVQVLRGPAHHHLAPPTKPLPVIVGVQYVAEPPPRGVGQVVHVLHLLLLLLVGSGHGSHSSTTCRASRGHCLPLTLSCQHCCQPSR